MAAPFKYQYALSGLFFRNLSISEFIYSLHQSAIYSRKPLLSSTGRALRKGKPRMKHQEIAHKKRTETTSEGKAVP